MNTLAVEIDSVSGDLFVTFPDDLIEKLSWKEGDEIEWIDQGDGSFLIRKV